MSTAFIAPQHATFCHLRGCNLEVARSVCSARGKLQRGISFARIWNDVRQHVHRQHTTDGTCQQHLILHACCCLRCRATPVNEVSDLLRTLRQAAMLEPQGPATDLLVWREDGPDQRPTWTQLHLDESSRFLSACGIAHGDVLLVQEHPDRIARTLWGVRPTTGREWLQQRARLG